jgi:hypothetical protein
MKSCVSTGKADAKGEETRFQAETGLFHWGMLFFPSEKRRA